MNSSSGVRTAFGGVYTGLLVIVCLAFLMPFCAFIPKATLAAVIMTAVIFSVEHHVIRPMWSSKSEFTVTQRTLLLQVLTVMSIFLCISRASLIGISLCRN